ncbi:MAG: nitrate reductase [Xanthobacteraceae bacterium]|nr:MAG: nitrate reductase [Xanthobacteraceae bacterium]
MNRAADRSMRTTCPYCGVGCGVLATPDGFGGATIAGDPGHPANSGKLCSKGTALGETLGLSHRLLTPMLRTPAGTLAPSGWDMALDRVAGEFSRIVTRDGPEAVAFYLSGQLLTEDYYVANKLMKGFIGSPHVDTNSRLCMASAVAGHRRAFGADVVPGCYADIDQADLIVLAGANAAWCHPILFQRMQRARAGRGARLVVIDPRRTASAEEADLVLAIRPGSDAVLFCGLLKHLADRGACDARFIADHTVGFDAALARAQEIAPSLDAVARATGIDGAVLAQFYDLFRATERTVTAFSQGINQSAQGTDKVNAIINCHLATGRIGKPGAGPFSLTGQPNAMGGREVGGMANQLAAHMDYTPAAIDRTQRFWNAPRMATREGYKAVDLFDAIGRGEIKALWVMGTNPAVSLPDAARARAALGRLELMVVSDNVAANDTIAAGAHVVLPALGWGEKSGTVTNSERRISRQRAFLPPPGRARPDWWIVSEVARRMGFGAAFAYTRAADIFREHAALSAFENNGARAFDLSGLAGLSDAAYDGLPPVQWPVRETSKRGRARMFDDGAFFTSDGKARFVAPDVPALATVTSAAFPLRLNTGRIRDQWHTMTRTGESPRLAQHLTEPFVEIHPGDVADAGIADGGFARLTTAYGACVLRVHVNEGQQRGLVFAPIHWSAATASDARVGALTAPITDPVSGQPEAKATPVAIAPVAYALSGFIVSDRELMLPPASWWARIAVPGGVGYAIAADGDTTCWHQLARRIAGGEIIEYRDGSRAYRAGVIVDGRLAFCLFVGPAGTIPAWDVVKALFAGGELSPAARRVLLSGRSCEGIADDGPVVCACFSIGARRIERLIAAQPRATIADIGGALRAGTNCGSCVPELKRLIAQRGPPRESAA